MAKFRKDDLAQITGNVDHTGKTGKIVGQGESGSDEHAEIERYWVEIEGDKSGPHL